MSPAILSGSCVGNTYLILESGTTPVLLETSWCCANLSGANIVPLISAKSNAFCNMIQPFPMLVLFCEKIICPCLLKTRRCIANSSNVAIKHLCLVHHFHLLDIYFERSVRV